LELFATAAAGTEGALRDELREHRFRGVRADRGGVHFQGDLAEAGRACLESRIAVRILVKLGEFDARDERALYDGVRGIDWSPWLTSRHTLAVSCVAKDSRLFHTKFLAQKTKDAIVDQLRDKFGSRPSVDVEHADVRVFLHLLRNRGTIFLDASGESLHKRGWRTHVVKAPLKETLAAACLRLAEWDRSRPFCDPMCGSGTIAIEAALWSRDVAPGLSRGKFGVERWACADRSLEGKMRDLRRAAKARIERRGPPILGADIDPRAIETAKRNARHAGVDVRFETRDVRKIAEIAPKECLVVTNPPYGERLEASRDFVRDMVSVFQTLSGSRVAILESDRAIERAMKRKPVKWQALWNGSIEVRLLVYDVP
jgi:putative N6-adenine-specific DNA methylase